MPIYCYEPRDGAAGCEHCRAGFEVLQDLDEPALTQCPECGAPVERVIAPPRIGRSISALDDRAKAAGFSKLQRLGKGEYEKVY